ncbi:MAG: alpha/beta hydrolase [Dehalococcoidia bacterium]
MTQERTNSRQRPASQQFDANGINIHYLDWGEGSPRHLVLLHGLTSHAHTWDYFAKEASDSFRVVAPDLRGHGESGYAEDGYTLGRFGEDVRALVRYLNLPTFDLVGHSLGALIAIRFTAENPELVNRLVLVDGGPGLDSGSAREGARGSFVRPLGFETIEEAKAWHRERNPNRSDEMLEQRVKYGMKQNWAGWWVLRHDPELYWLLEDGSSGFRQEEQALWEMLGNIPCPVLVLRGQESLLLSSKGAQRMAEATPNAKLVEIPGAGHSIPSDAPDLFKDAVLEFLRE